MATNYRLKRYGLKVLRKKVNEINKVWLKENMLEAAQDYMTARIQIQPNSISILETAEWGYGGLQEHVLLKSVKIV